MTASLRQSRLWMTTWLTTARTSTDGWWEFYVLILKHLPIDNIGVCFGWIAGLWGLWVLNPWIDAYASAPAYQEMLHWTGGHEWPWGAALGLGFWLQVWGIRHGHYRAARVGAGLLMYVWAFVGMSFVLHNWRMTATVSVPASALVELWVFVRLAYDRRQRELLMRHVRGRSSHEP